MANNITLASSLRMATSKFYKRLLKMSRVTESLSMTELATLGHLYRNEANYPSELAALVVVNTIYVTDIEKSGRSGSDN